jgi:thiosulfate reductase cytochrome b subunit
VKRLEMRSKHPLAIRWCHWVNFPLLALMIWSGLWIYWANDVYRLGFGSFTLFRFFPEGFYRAFGVSHQLARGMAWHFFFMWFFAINGVLYVAYTILSGEWRYLVPNRQSFREAVLVTLHDLGLDTRTHPSGPPSRAGRAGRGQNLQRLCPHFPVGRGVGGEGGKFNGAQQIAYTGVILMGFGSLLTGLAIYKPTQFAWLSGLLGGYMAARFEHFVLALGYVLFFLIHVAQVIRAGWNNFRSMVSGYELVSSEEGTHE